MRLETSGLGRASGFRGRAVAKPLIFGYGLLATVGSWLIAGIPHPAVGFVTVRIQVGGDHHGT